MAHLERCRRLIARVLRVIDRHPVRVTAVAGVLVAVGQCVWIATHRRVGAYDPDEAGYLATSLRYSRSLGDGDLRQLVDQVLQTLNAPLVPLLSAPLVWLGGGDPAVALMIQPLLAVMAAAAGAAVAQQLAGPRAAVAAGLWILTAPAVMRSGQTYWYGLGAGTFLMVAVWALTSSDRLQNRRAWIFGAAVGAMLLSRTMTLSFLPGVVLAACVVAGRERRSWLGLGKAFSATVLIASPWWVSQRTQLLDYLGRYGYGSGAAHYSGGEESLWGRLGVRILRLMSDVALVPLRELFVAVTVVGAVWIVSRADRRRRIMNRWREFVPIAIILASGFAALLSSANAGVWFELPLAVLVIPPTVAVIARTAKVVRLTVTAVMVVNGVAVLCALLWIVPVDDQFVSRSYYEAGFSMCDERFSNNDRDRWDLAAAEWRRLSTDIVDIVSDDQARWGSVYSLTGSTILFNSNTLNLAAEQASVFASLSVPDTTKSEEARRADLTPTVPSSTGETVERVLLIADHDCTPFEIEREVQSFLDQALGLGWEIDRTLPMPSGGRVLLLRHPSAS